MLFKKKKTIPTFTFYDSSQDISLISSKMKQRQLYADEALEELNSMIGLKPVKKWIVEQQSILKINKERQNAGIYIKNNQTMHMVFLGNPGTGKTETARLLGKIYFGLGILPTDSFIEVSRRDLVGDGYQTSAEKVNKIIQEAMGGILFIDEAYSVCYGEYDQPGKEAVDTLLKLMEDHRDNIAVIMAGYTNEMTSFLKTNPGFDSRIPPNNKLFFDDYDLEELIEIFKLMVLKNGYLLAKDITAEDIRQAIITMPKTNGNARDVRNLVDQIKMKQDVLLANKTVKDSNELITITKEAIKEP